MMKRCIYLFILVVFVSSCIEDKLENIGDCFEDFSSNTESIDVLTVSSFDDFNSFVNESDGLVYPDYDHSLNSLPKELLCLGVKGCSRKIVRKSYPKLRFDKDFAIKIGVNSNLIYSVQYLRIEADIDTKGKKFFSYPSPYCGGTPIVVNGNENTDYDHLGYSIRSIGNPTVLATHLIYIDCTFPQGSAVKKYYPRNPKDLEWNYNLY